MSYAIPTLYESTGALAFPLEADADIDPARDRLLELFKMAINYEFGARWTAAVQSLDPRSKFFPTLPVSDALPCAPTKRAIEQRKSGFPLLCLHRSGDIEVEQYVMDSHRLVQDWTMHWILGPGDLEVERKLGDFWPGIVKLVAHVIRQRGHSAYDNGRLQFFTDTSAISGISIVRASPLGVASFSDEDSATYHAGFLTLSVTEVARDNLEAYPDFVAADVDVALTDATDRLPGFAAGASDAPG